MLVMQDVVAAYGTVQVLNGFSLEVRPGEILCLLGRNGAGKTSALRAIMGLLPLRSGSIALGGESLPSLAAHEIPKRGLGYVPQGRRLFAELTVAENLEIGLMCRNTHVSAKTRALDLFPALKDRLTQRAGTMSGGEQQMLAMARALCVDPKLLLLDEPTEGLMPSMIARIRESVLALKAEGVTTVLVEQRVDAVLPVADRVAFVDRGEVKALVAVEQLKADRNLIDRYVGVS